MAYDEGLAHRIREHCEGDPRVSEKKMFGGLCFLVGGHMACGVVGDELMLRVGPDAYADCLERPHAREMDFTGRALKGMVYVAPEGFAEDEDLAAWLECGFGFAGGLPPKTAMKKTAMKKTAKKKTAARTTAAKKTAKKKAAKKRASR